MNSFLKMFKNAFVLTAVMMLLCAVVYPLALTGISQVLFHKQANGSLIQADGEVIGSELIGQDFTDSKFFRGRVSSVNYNTYREEDCVPDADGSTVYGGVSSGNFNYSATNPDLRSRVETDLKAFLESHPDVKMEDIPADLLTASASGLDPHISLEAAGVQLSAISEATGLTQEELSSIVKNHTEHKIIGIFGEEKMNVLEANIEIAQEIGILSDGR